MPRVFVTIIDSHLIQLIEDFGFEVIPITSDSIIDNIESLESSDIVLLDESTPSWVLRESTEHNHFVVAYQTLPNAAVTALVFTLNDLQHLLDLIRPLSNKLTPVDDQYVMKMAEVQARFGPGVQR